MKNKTTLAPLFTQHLLTRMVFSVIAGMGIASCLLSESVLAEQTAPNYDHPLQEFKKDQQEQNTYSPSGGSSDFNIFNLIHQAQLGTNRDLGEFSQEQGHNLDSAAAKFRLQQRQLLRNQNQATPATPVTPSSEVKN